MDPLPFRSHFPALDGRIYLNTASEGAMPAAAVSAAVEIARIKERPWELGGELYYEVPASIRERIETITRAPAGSVALVAGTSAGIGIAARGLVVASGEEILLLEAQFPSNVNPWRAAVARGASIRVAPRPLGSDPTQALIDAIGPRTRVVAIDWVNFVDGAVVDLETVGGHCRTRDIRFVVDAAQGLGALRLDLSRVPVDILAAPSHKWLLGPNGTGFVHVAPQLIESLHPWNAGWINLAARAGFRNLLRLDGAPPPDATRFETGTPAYALFVPWKLSLDLIAGAGVLEIEQRVLGLASRLATGLLGLAPAGGRAAGVRVLTPGAPAVRSGIVSFSAGERTAALYHALAREEIVVALREGTIRASTHAYNTEHEVDSLLDACRRFLG